MSGPLWMTQTREAICSLWLVLSFTDPGMPSVRRCSFNCCTAKEEKLLQIKECHAVIYEMHAPVQETRESGRAGALEPLKYGNCLIV